MITSSPGLTAANIASTSPPLVPLVTNTSPVGMAILGVDCARQLLAQRGHALRQRIAVLAGVDRVDRRLLASRPARRSRAGRSTG